MKHRAEPTPSQLARTARALLRRAAGGRAPARATRFFKPWERVYGYGIGTPRLRLLLGELYHAVRRQWRSADALAFAERLLRHRAIEGRALGIELLGRFGRDAEPALLGRIRRWLAAGRCDNWALTDDLSIRVLAPLLRRYPRLVPALETWTGHQSLWVRRAAAVSLVPLARRGEQLDTAYRVATRLLGDPEDLIHKATGWLLRDAGRIDPERLAAYLIAQGPRVPRTALRYAIERWPQAKRRELLARTKGTAPGGGPGRSARRSGGAR
ncbi:MAG TPA: DNA alkylation repair protein [Gemmatimonadales bacterium]|nr:DNA alkylation repair protein [Gemmatimonadales bacterium]